VLKAIDTLGIEASFSGKINVFGLHLLILIHRRSEPSSGKETTLFARLIVLPLTR